MENNLIDNNEMNGNQQLPNSTGVLVLGILSIVFCFCYGILGLILGIIALVLASKSIKLYNENMNLFTLGSYKNLKAGRICAIIGTSLSALYVLIIIIMLIAVGNIASIQNILSGMK